MVALAGFRSIARFRRPGELPEFLLIGAQKAGTTSLFDYLCQSPAIAPPSRKEVHYFDRYRQPPLRRYRRFFPKLVGANGLTGEATPFYLFHPYAAQRIYASGLRPRLIAILRCPQERAMSHYSHEWRKGRETLSFAEAVLAEEERLQGTVDRVLNRRHLNALQRYSYISRGRYMPQLQRYIDIFGRESLLVTSLDALRRCPAEVVARCCQFLGVPMPEQTIYSIRNQGKAEGNFTVVDPRIFAQAFSEDLQMLEDILPEAATWRARIETERPLP